MTLPPGIDRSRLIIIFFAAVIGFATLFRGDYIAAGLFFAMGAVVAGKTWWKMRDGGQDGGVDGT